MKRVLFAAALLAVSSGPVLAQPRYERGNAPDTFVGPVAGSQEATLSGTGTNDKHFDNGSFGITGSYGYYFNDNIELALRQTVNWANVDSENSLNGVSRVAFDYHFNLGRFRPFIGVNIGAIYGDNVENTGIAGPEVGLKYFVNDTTFILAQTEYQFFFNSGDELTDNFDDGSFVHTLGLGFIF